MSYTINKFTLDKDHKVRYIEYNIRNDGYTWKQTDYKVTFDQDLKLRCNESGLWSATMNVCGSMDMNTPRDAVGKLGVWLRAMADALDGIGDRIEYGITNPLDPNDSNRYSLEGIIKKIKDQECPLYIRPEEEPEEYEED